MNLWRLAIVDCRGAEAVNVSRRESRRERTVLVVEVEFTLYGIEGSREMGRRV